MGSKKSGSTFFDTGNRRTQTNRKCQAKKYGTGEIRWKSSEAFRIDCPKGPLLKRNSLGILFRPTEWSTRQYPSQLSWLISSLGQESGSESISLDLCWEGKVPFVFWACLLLPILDSLSTSEKLNRISAMRLNNIDYGYLTHPQAEWKDLFIYESQTTRTCTIFELYKKITNKGNPFFLFFIILRSCQINSTYAKRDCVIR